MAVVELDGQAMPPIMQEIYVTMATNYYVHRVSMVTNVAVTITTEKTFLWEGSINSH